MTLLLAPFWPVYYQHSLACAPLSPAPYHSILSPAPSHDSFAGAALWPAPFSRRQSIRVAHHDGPLLASSLSDSFRSLYIRFRKRAAGTLQRRCTAVFQISSVARVSERTRF